MQIFRRLKPIKAMSFDLDDTLYSNLPIMLAANEQMKAFFRQTLPSGNDYDIDFWFRFRNLAIQENPNLKHDVVAVRIVAYTKGIQSLGLPEAEAVAIANKAMAHFIEHRSNFEVPQASHDLLKRLSEAMPLVAISNGNVDTSAIGISHYFQKTYHAENGIKQKPAIDMFDAAQKKLGINAENILHVGDCGKADIMGASMANFQSAYLPKYGIGKPLRLIPNVQLDDVTELMKFV